MQDWAAELVDRGQVREQERVRAQDEAVPEEERPIVDRHERLANGDERASVGASSSRHVFPQRHDRYDADDADDDDSNFRQTAAHVSATPSFCRLTIGYSVTAVPMTPMTSTISKNAPINT
jgi:hypothetical protein